MEGERQRKRESRLAGERPWQWSVQNNSNEISYFCCPVLSVTSTIIRTINLASEQKDEWHLQKPKVKCIGGLLICWDIEVGACRAPYGTPISSVKWRWYCNIKRSTWRLRTDQAFPLHRASPIRRRVARSEQSSPCRKKNGLVIPKWQQFL